VLAASLVIFGVGLKVAAEIFTIPARDNSIIAVKIAHGAAQMAGGQVVAWVIRRIGDRAGGCLPDRAAAI
jgi:hypothetical protein